MAFETNIISTFEECYSVRDKYQLEKTPFSVYRYDKENNVYIFITFGIDYEHPGKFFLIWNDMVCRMSAYPTERFNISNDNPEKSFLIQSIHVPENFNKDKEMLIDLLEQAFTGFEVLFNEKIYIFKIIIDREQLSKNICINYIPID